VDLDKNIAQVFVWRVGVAVGSHLPTIYQDITDTNGRSNKKK